MLDLLSGLAFGAALTVSGVYHPDVIISQLQLRSFHMLQSFLTATATTNLIVTLLNNRPPIQLTARPASSLGLFSRHDGNLLGGALLGAGMALAGGCPGTVLVQAAGGVRSGLPALGGAAFAGLLWAGLLRPRFAAAAAAAAAEGAAGRDAPGSGRGAVVVGFQALCAAAVAAAGARAASEERAGLVHPVVGGLAIGGAQLVSLLLGARLVGVSGCYEEMGDIALCRLGGKGGRKIGRVVFSAGIMAAAWVVVRLGQLPTATFVDISPMRGFLGGLLMVLGAMIAGGCTSGHGISGISLLSISSFVTISSAFAVGTALARAMQLY